MYVCRCSSKDVKYKSVCLSCARNCVYMFKLRPYIRSRSSRDLCDCHTSGKCVSLWSTIREGFDNFAGIECMYVCMYVSMRFVLYVRMYVCVCTYVCTYVCMVCMYGMYVFMSDTDDIIKTLSLCMYVCTVRFFETSVN